MNLEQIICPNCQGVNFITENNTYTCRYCLSEFTQKQIDSKVFVDLRIANFERNSANFDKAKKLYSEIIKNNPEEDLSDVYFGQFLCEQRVLFEEDGKGEKFPSFYRMNLDEESTVDDSPSFAKALSYALKHNRNRLESFNTLADKIDEARKMYFDIQSKTKPFDIFICFKNSDENGNHTPDRELAMDIYNELSSKYNIFFSEKTLKNIKSNYREYEPNIYYGLYTAKVMLLICSKKEYLESQWLKNEWNRFTQINRQGQNEKCIIPIFTDNFNPNDLPDELWHTQGIFDDRKLMTTLENTLENILHPVDKLEELRKQQEELLNKQREELLKNQKLQQEEQEKQRLEQERQIKEQQEKYAFLEKFIREQQEKEEQKQKAEQEKELKRQQEEQEKQNEILQKLDNLAKVTRGSNKAITDINAPVMSNDEKTVTFGRYLQNGKIKPIKWKVLTYEDNICKLISNEILEERIFGQSGNYEQSDIRRWLNYEFYDKAFNEEEKLYILKTKNEKCEDNITLLSGDEISLLPKLERDKQRSWWLSSKSNRYESYAEKIEFGGIKSDFISNKPLGVVPVITVILELDEKEKKEKKQELTQNNNTVEKSIEEKINDGLIPKINTDNETISFGKYIQTSSNYEPVNWKILKIENEKATVIADRILKCDIFDMKTNIYNKSRIFSTISYMFLEIFNEEQRNFVSNFGLPSENDIELLNTEDRLKKLSRYAKSNSKLIKYIDETNLPTSIKNITDKTLKQKASKDNTILLNNAKWFLSSYNKDSFDIVYGVDEFGNIIKNIKSDTCCGIVPMVTLNLNPYNSKKISLEIQKLIQEKENKKQEELRLKQEELRLKQEKIKEQERQKEEKLKEKIRLELEAKEKEKQEKLELERLKKIQPILSEDKQFIIFGNYPQENNTPKPIKWQYFKIKDNVVTIMSEQILDCRIFDEKSKDFKSSELKKWLNTEFYNLAFTDEQKEYINTSLGNQSKVYIPLIEDIEKLDEDERVKTPTDYAENKANLVITNQNQFSGNTFWWIDDTKNTLNGFTASIDYKGTIYKPVMVNKPKGVVPCIDVIVSKEIATEIKNELQLQNSIKQQRKYETYKAIENEKLRVSSLPKIDTYKTRLTFGSFSTSYNTPTSLDWKIININENEAFVIAYDVLAYRHFGSTNNYTDSDIRKWLNNEFLNTAFTKGEQLNIIDTQNEYGTDKIFLINEEELNKFSLEHKLKHPTSIVDKTDITYVTSDKERYYYKDALSDIKKYNKEFYKQAKKSPFLLIGNTKWWTRDTYEYNEDRVKVVNIDGNVTLEKCTDKFGVVPAFRVKIK